MKSRALTRRGACRCCDRMRSVLICRGPGLAAADRRPAAAQDRYFITSDGVRLHYLEAGPRTATPSSLCPAGPCPRGSGSRSCRRSRDTTTWWRSIRAARAIPTRRLRLRAAAAGQDIAELIAHLTPVPVVLVGWSLGVLDTLAYVHSHGDQIGRRPGAGGQLGGRGTAAAAAGAAPSRPGAAARHRHAPFRARHVPPPAERQLYRSAHRGDAAHAGTGEPRAAGLSAAAHLLARGGVRHHQAGAVCGAARLAGGAGGEPGAQPPRHADRRVQRRRPRAVRR